MTDGYVEKSLSPLDEDIEKINRFTRSEFSADMLYVFSVVLCNNDIDRDYEKFSVNALNELCDKFIGKTGIFDHSMKSADQKARIFDAYVERVDGRKTADGDDYYQLKAKAYMVRTEDNMPLITEIEAGIKKEVSVSCSVKSSICSICGTDKRSARCEHIGGRAYDGKVAYSVLDGVSDAYEFSFVAVPAQREAGVTKAFDLLKEESAMTDIISTLKGCDTGITLSKGQVDMLVSKLENLESEAQLGQRYKKELTQEVIALCSKAMPQMDLKVFGNVAQVLTTSELIEFKKAFSEKGKSFAVEPQIKRDKTEYNVNQFKI